MKVRGFGSGSGGGIGGGGGGRMIVVLVVLVVDVVEVVVVVGGGGSTTLNAMHTAVTEFVPIGVDSAACRTVKWLTPPSLTNVPSASTAPADSTPSARFDVGPSTV
ncbi:MAG: hypothetical protein P8J50_17070 [Acidimicrobiales bacterium]|nr:hypothetical protein [Acidimicrobiales bacterium]